MHQLLADIIAGKQRLISWRPTSLLPCSARWSTTRLSWGESDLVVNSMVFSCTKPRKNLCFDDKNVMILRIRASALCNKTKKLPLFCRKRDHNDLSRTESWLAARQIAPTTGLWFVSMIGMPSPMIIRTTMTPATPTMVMLSTTVQRVIAHIRGV